MKTFRINDFMIDKEAKSTVQAKYENFTGRGYIINVQC